MKIELDEALRHEIGHLIMARELGFRLDEIYFEFESDTVTRGVSSLLPETLCSIPDVQDYCRRRIKVLMAASAAEELRLIDGVLVLDRAAGFEKSMSGERDSDDAKIKELSLLYFNMTNEHADTIDACLKDDLIHQTQCDLWEETCLFIETNAYFLYGILRTFLDLLLQRGNKKYVQNENVIISANLLRVKSDYLLDLADKHLS